MKHAIVLRGLPRSPTISVILMDASDSMTDNFGDAPKLALQEFTKSLASRPDADNIFVGIFTFADELSLLVQPQPVKQIDEIDYVTNGMTRLYASVLDVITFLEAAVGRHPDAKILINVFTDGADNKSSLDALNRLRYAAGEARRRGWELRLTAFTDGKIDGNAIAEKMNFCGDSTINVPVDRASIINTSRYAAHVTGATSTGIRPMTYADFSRTDATPPPSSR